MDKKSFNNTTCLAVTAEKISILGVNVHDVTMDETITWIERYIHSSEPHLVVTLGTEMIMAAYKNRSLLALLDHASLALPDGGGLLWASRRLGKPLREKVTGVDLVEKLCSLSSENNWKLFFFGGKPGIAEAAAQNLRNKFPEANIAGTAHGYLRDEEIIPILRSVKPDILFAGLGFPKQEQWLSANLQGLKIPVGIGVGGSFDVLSGALQRAPSWMRQLNLEWLFRLMQEPGRFTRMLSIPMFMLRVWKEKLMQGGTPPRKP